MSKPLTNAAVWTASDDARYAELYRFLCECAEPAEHFEKQVELVSLRDKAISLQMLVDLLPF